MQTFRRVFKWLIPSSFYSAEGDGERILYSLGAMQDASVERLRQGLESRMPSRAWPSANALTAADRGLLRGRVETEAAFAARLAAWRSPRTHRVRGNAYEAVAQVANYWGPGTFVETADQRGNRVTIDDEGTVGSDNVTWNWDGLWFDPSGVTAAAATSVTGSSILTLAIPENLPGSLLLVHVFAESGALAGISPPGFEIVANHVPSGTLRHVLLARVSDGTEAGEITIERTVSTGRIIGRVLQVPAPVGVPWRADALANFHETVLDSGSGNPVPSPAFIEAPWHAAWFAFVGHATGSVLGTLTGDNTWNTVGNATAGAVAISQQYAFVAQDSVPNESANIAPAPGVWGSIGVRLRRPWARFWVHLFAEGAELPPDLGDADLWGGSLDPLERVGASTDYVLGLAGVTLADVTAMRDLFGVYNWHPAHTTPEWAVFRFDETWTVGNGDYRTWSLNIAGTQVSTRPPWLRFVSLSPAANNRYAGDPESFCEAATEVDGVGTYTGDPEAAGVWSDTALPNGVFYAGNPDRFPLIAQLVDDGSSVS